MNVKYICTSSLLLVTFACHQNMRKEAVKWRMKERSENLLGISRLYYMWSLY